jgi:hypothetical protein
LGIKQPHHLKQQPRVPKHASGGDATVVSGALVRTEANAVIAPSAGNVRTAVSEAIVASVRKRGATDLIAATDPISVPIVLKNPIVSSLALGLNSVATAAEPVNAHRVVSVVSVVSAGDAMSMKKALRISH